MTQATYSAFKTARRPWRVLPVLASLMFFRTTTLASAQIVFPPQPYLAPQHALVLNRLAFARLAINEKVEDTVLQYGGTLRVIAELSIGDFGKIFLKAKAIDYPIWNAANMAQTQ